MFLARHLKPLGLRAHRSTLCSGVFHARLFSAKTNAGGDLFARRFEFVERHVGPSPLDVEQMLNTIGFESLDALIAATIPKSILSQTEIPVDPKCESIATRELKQIMDENVVAKSFIGNGYHGTITPPVILRNMLENPAWYTAYTPYQSEISQGRLQMLFNFQTMICDLTGMPVANASLLDEATAAAEAMATFFSVAKKGRKTFLISDDCHPQTIAVCRTRAAGFDIDVKVLHHTKFDFTENDVFGVLVQYPATNGQIDSFEELTEDAHENGALVAASADLLSLALLKPPGEWGADICLGSAQRFGVGMGYGGPHAAFFASTTKLMRKLPGRIIGISKDSRGLPAVRMAIQTREQHIRRDKATSNICTAQALLANMAAAYGIYHGAGGLRKIASRVHGCARLFAAGLADLGIIVKTDYFFDTVHVDLDGAGNATEYCKAAEKNLINIRHINKNNIYVAFDETHSPTDVNMLLSIFAEVKGAELKFSAFEASQSVDMSISSKFRRTSEFLTNPIFSKYHSETEMLRYLYHLQGMDLSLATAMIPLGSCTMKLNATSEMIPVTWDSVMNIHPFAPASQTRGYAKMLSQLGSWLAACTGFHSISFQPNAGSQGEYAGLLVIQAYHRSRGDSARNVCFIPTSAHGTNPASAAMIGLKRVVIKCDEMGNIDVNDLREQAIKHKDNLSCLMATYPSTHGVFEERIKEICEIIHDHGGQVYMDGANMNAQVGLCSPGEIGADVCHLNLHKTFCIPHGGGGPGMGPIGVAEHLAPFLPSHPYAPSSEKTSVGAISAAPFASPSILPITWMYIRMMGGSGLKYATQSAILCANYMAKRLEDYYKILYLGVNKTCAHEFILDIRPLKAKSGISEEDIAKRLIDYNFHSPTMSFPVAGTLMIEPTESESKFELDRFCDAMIHIRQEIQDVIDGTLDKTNNPLKNAPHTADMVISDSWDRPYSRERAAYPTDYSRTHKFWPTVGRVDNAFGDRNFVGTCPTVDPNMDETK